MGYKLVISVLVVSAAYLIRQQYFPPPVKSPIVEITSGKLQGRVSVSRDGRSYFEYLGVPYAKPPLGQLRYEPPEPVEKKWDGVRDATILGAVCIQIDSILKSIEGSEDCLFVNIHTPKLDSVKQPVMVWFHGGNFAFGSGNDYRPDYFMDEDIVVVTVNYRLTSFGFLNTGDGIVRGNMGLKDQNMALRWVRDNIRHFGGNPNSVTIFGESAGGGAVHYHIISPMSKGLFHKAISQSGVVHMPWGVNLNPIRQVKRFAKQANCPTGSAQEMVKCLKSRNAEELVLIHKEGSDNMRPIIAMFYPTIEKDLKDGKAFVTENPRTLVENGKFSKVPFLAGINSGEGLMFSAFVIGNKTIARHLAKDWAKTLESLMVFAENVDPAVVENIKDFYNVRQLELDNPTFSNMENLTNMFSDWTWKLGFHNSMQSHSKFITQSAPLFIYYYDYPGENLIENLLVAINSAYHPIIEIAWMKVKNWIKTNLLGHIIPTYGACHMDEVAMEFYIPHVMSVAKGSKDYQFSKDIINVLVQFVNLDTKSSKPPTLEFIGERWTPQDANKPLKYFQLNSKPKMISEPFKTSVDYWNSLKLQE